MTFLSLTLLLYMKTTYSKTTSVGKLYRNMTAGLFFILDLVLLIAPKHCSPSEDLLVFSLNSIFIRFQ